MRRSRASVAGLQETAATNGTSERAICFDWSSAPARGGSKTRPSKAFELLEGQRPAEQVALLGRDPLQAGGEAKARSSAASAAASPSTAWTSDFARQPQREGAAAGKQVGDLLGARQMAADELGHRLLGGASPAGRRRAAASTATSPNITIGFLGSTMISPSIDSRAKPSRMTKSDAARRRCLSPACRVVDGDVEAGGGRRDRQAEGVAAWLRSAPASARSAVERGDDLRQRDRAFLDVDDLVRQRAVVAEQHAAPRCAAPEATRRRVCGAHGTSSPTGDVDAAARKACTTLSRFQAR